MSLIPMVFRSLRPSSWMEQHLRMMRQMENIFASPSLPINQRMMQVEWKDPWYVSEQNDGKNPFTIKLDVKNFAPKEITVKTVDENIIIEGKHEEQCKEKGTIMRHFVKTFNLPMGCEAEDVVSSLSKDGILTITAPNKIVPEVSNERKVPIEVEEEIKEKAKN